MIAPVLWLCGLAAIVIVWIFATPDWIMVHFDQDGMSPIELTTIGLFFAEIGFFWLVPPMLPGLRRTLFLTDLLSDLVHRDLPRAGLAQAADFGDAPSGSDHGDAVQNALPAERQQPAARPHHRVPLLRGHHRPMRGNPALLPAAAAARIFKLHPVCWTLACLGGAFVASQFADRLPANLRHMFGIHVSDSVHALLAALEEGQELLLPIFVILATLQAHFIYNTIRPTTRRCRSTGRFSERIVRSRETLDAHTRD
jgi:hypothetical protein